MSLKKVESELEKKEKELRQLRKENRKLRGKIKDLAASSVNWKDKFLKTKKELKIQSVTCGNSTLFTIDRHKYDELLVQMSVNIYVLGRSGFRGVIKILSYLNKTLKWGLKQLPCKSSVENWVQKAGYHIYASVDNEKYQDGYGIIVDECMVVGQERMLAVLGVPAAKSSKTALALSDVDVLALHVKASWDGQAVEAMVKSVTEKMGKPALYAISDGAHNLRNGLYKAGIPRICDSGHQIALLIEQIYKKVPEFESFNKAMAMCKLKEVMKPTAYLLPPRQRSIARFMNLSKTVRWAAKMLGIQSGFNEAEQKAFFFLNSYALLIRELSIVFEMINALLRILKNEGLCYAAIAACIEKCNLYKGDIYPKINLLVDRIKNYLQSEKDKLPDAQTVWHVSSDVIESLFGLYKSRKASNSLHGVTPFVLSLPLFTKADRDTATIHCDFKHALESVFMSDLKQWNIDNLIVNQVNRRNEAFRK